MSAGFAALAHLITTRETSITRRTGSAINTRPSASPSVPNAWTNHKSVFGPVTAVILGSWIQGHAPVAT
jgi:hypothetical protein